MFLAFSQQHPLSYQNVSHYLTCFHDHSINVNTQIFISLSFQRNFPTLPIKFNFHYLKTGWGGLSNIHSVGAMLKARNEAITVSGEADCRDESEC